MNELFEFRNQLNIKKVIGITTLAVFFLIMLFNLFFSKNENSKKDPEDSNPYKTYTSEDSRISLELPKRYNLKEVQGDYTMQLNSDDGLLINFEEKPMVFGKSLNEIIASDKNLYIQKFENIFDISDIQIFTPDNNNLLTSYKYSFKHIVGAIEYDVQVFWMQGSSSYYIISISMPNTVLEKYHSLESEIASSLKYE